jgi:hypothetical protein
MTIHVSGSERFLHNLKARMPFRYGIAELTAIPHLFLRLDCHLDGSPVSGVAAESLIPKWFTKVASTNYQDEIDEMLQGIENACQLAEAAGPCRSVFELWQHVYGAQRVWGAQRSIPPLLWNLGVSLVERAAIDAFCRSSGQAFPQALRQNSLGIDLGAVHSPLAGMQPADLLPAEPARAIIARHTIGLSDPLVEADLSPAERVEDGLPQTLQDAIRSYGLTHFKIKLSGNDEFDLERLRQVRAVLEAEAGEEYAFTLDGNEQYASLESFSHFWNLLSIQTDLAPFREKLLFVEQPLHRQAALAETTLNRLKEWEDRPLMIIDESDAELHSLPSALSGGYCGTSHKNCKGIFKGIAGACLLEWSRREGPGACRILSGEDLVNVGPVALQQDLAVMACLGIEHVERNGHHYFSGLSMFPEEIQSQMLAHHSDLYGVHPGGYPVLKIHQGRLALDSVLQAPFGVAAAVDPACCFVREAAWSYHSLAQHL